MGKDHYKPLLDWMRDALLGGEYVSPEDLDLYHVTDDPEDAAEFIRNRVEDLLREGRDPTELVVKQDKLAGEE
jgi:hypothetical protein